MKQIYVNGELSEKKKYYKHILIKSKNNGSIISVAFIISLFKDKEYQILTRYYKVESEGLKLEYINTILEKLFNKDIVKNIIYYFLRDSVHFTSIKANKSYNTLKIIITIKYDDNLKIYKSFIDYVDLSKNKDYKIIKLILKEISEKFVNLLNMNNKFDINDLFTNMNNEIDLIDYKIYNSYQKFGGTGWGIDYNIKKY